MKIVFCRKHEMYNNFSFSLIKQKTRTKTVPLHSVYRWSRQNILPAQMYVWSMYSANVRRRDSGSCLCMNKIKLTHVLVNRFASRSFFRRMCFFFIFLLFIIGDNSTSWNTCGHTCIILSLHLYFVFCFLRCKCVSHLCPFSNHSL